ncbi:MAG: nitrilase-related carbon-nitrogen hydrolase, partial [Chitinophagaceae bacterium]
KAYSAGNKRSIATVGGWRIMVQICYDLRFPVWARQQVATNDGKPEYDVLIFVANWPEKRKQAWITLLKARAIENQCYVIAVNRVGTDGNGHYYSGNSCIIDPLGNELLHIENEESAFTYSLSYELLLQLRNQFPFLQDADNFRLLQ